MVSALTKTMSCNIGTYAYDGVNANAAGELKRLYALSGCVAGRT